METHVPIKDKRRRSVPPSGDARSDTGYEEWLAAEIEAGCAELDAGRHGLPAKQVWKELGLS